MKQLVAKPDRSPRPTVFVGSSAEGLKVAKAIGVLLDYACQVTIWSQGVFGLGEGTLESLVRALDNFDFAILALTPDDLAESRGKEQPAPRDNVLLELGLFIGALGRERTFALYDRASNIKLPSDLAGVTLATYEPHDQPGALRAALGVPCTLIEDTIARLGVRSDRSISRQSFVSDDTGVGQPSLVAGDLAPRTQPSPSQGIVFDDQARAHILAGVNMLADAGTAARRGHRAWRPRGTYPTHRAERGL